MKHQSFNCMCTMLVFLLVTAGLVFVTLPCSGQANRATITGIVTDPTGAVIPGTDVTAINTGTNVPTKTVSNNDGIYVLPNLFPGQYNLTFEKSGFETVQRPGLTLHSTEDARIDAVMKVGAATTSVTVNGGAPILDMDTASVGTNMKADVVNDLSLNINGGGRFVETFAVAITPGYSVLSSPYGAVVNGGQWFAKDYTIDGTSGTSNIRGDSMDGGPSMEAIEEVQAQTSGLDAQSSITGGGVMAFNLKSGTNTLHGSAFLYGHNELLDANTWTNDNEGVRKPKDRTWDYGFSLGGPIHKNKTFFFGTFERYQQEDWRLNSGGATVPTSAMLGGDLSGVLGTTLCTDLETGNTDTCADIVAIGDTPAPIMTCNTALQPVQAQVDMIYDPTTSGAAPTTNCPKGPYQFAGNVIPSGRLSAVAQKVNAFYANYAPNLGGTTNNERTLLTNTPSQTPNWYVVKLDHVLREQDHLSGSWIYDHKLRTLDDGGGVWQSGSTTGGPLSNARIQFYHQQEYRISESHTFSPRMLNVINFTSAFDDNGSTPTVPGNYNSQIGFGNTGSNNFPEISFSDNQAGISETYIGNTWQGDVAGSISTTGDTLTWTKGRHNLSFGGDFIAHDINYRSGTGANAFNFSYLNTAGPGYPYDGFGFATYELGQVNNASQTVAYNLYGRQKNIDLFAQDSYKITPKLTLNPGLRWTYNTRFHEKNGNWANFDPTVVDPQLTSVYGAALPGSLVFANGGGDSFDKYEYPNNYGPTLGIAYQLLPNVVIHASYGLIFNPVGVTFFGGVPDSFAPQLGSNSANSFDWDNGSGGGNYSGVVTKASLATDPSTMLPFPVETDPRSLRLGYSEAFNFGVQQELTSNMRFELSYVGNRGHRLTDTALAWNETTTQKFLSLIDQNPGFSIWNWMYCPSGYGSVSGVACPYPNFYGSPLAALAPLPQMAAAETDYWYGCCANINYAGLPLGQSFYDSLVAEVVKRAGNLTMDMSYVWSRQEGNSFSTEQDYNNGYTGVEDFQNMHGASHALTGYDLPQVVKGYGSYKLPFGAGQRWGATQNPAVRTVIGGWTATTLVDYYTGQPFRVGAADPYWPLWGNIYPQFNLTGYKGPTNPGKYVPVGSSGTPPTYDFYMPSSVASNPAAGFLPLSPYTSRLRCPGQANENTTFLKNDKVGPDGKYNVSLRMDFYNLFNRHYYNIEGCGGNTAQIGSPTFGEILGVQDNPRSAQFAVRLDF
ncbi:MAG: TonB-dependent receptor domain-containing protein [Terracidiphilus sp.]